MEREVPMPKVSIGQQQVTDLIRSLTNAEVVENAVGVIGAYHLDVYLPADRFAVEYNGDFWHSHRQKVIEGKSSAYEYHRTKRELCSNKGITLVFVWEGDWKSRQSEVQEALVQLLAGEPPASILRRLSPADDPLELGLFATPEAAGFTT